MPLSRNDDRPAPAAVAPVNGCVAVSPIRHEDRLERESDPGNLGRDADGENQLDDRLARLNSGVQDGPGASAILTQDLHARGAEQVFDGDGRLDFQAGHTQERALRLHRRRTRREGGGDRPGEDRGTATRDGCAHHRPTTLSFMDDAAQTTRWTAVAAGAGLAGRGVHCRPSRGRGTGGRGIRRVRLVPGLSCRHPCPLAGHPDGEGAAGPGRAAGRHPGRLHRQATRW